MSDPNAAHGADAEDDGTLGSHTIPAMLKATRSLINGHQVLLASSLEHCSADRLSTVMGTFKALSWKSQTRDKLLVDFHSLNRAINDLINSDDDDAQKLGLAAQKDVHQLIKLAAEAQSQHWKLELPAILEEYLEDNLVGDLNKSSEEKLRKAECFAVQCMTLHQGVKAGQPWKREQAVVQFQKDLEFMVEKYNSIGLSKTQLAESRNIASELRATNSIQEQIDNEEIAERLKRADQYVRTFVQNIGSVAKEISAHFSNGVAMSFDGRADLTIPNDLISKSRGSWVRKELPIWYKKHVAELVAVIPYMNRVLNDYDALAGEYWKPPTTVEAEIQIPDAFQNEWHQCNQALARLLVSALSQDQMTKFTFTYSYGTNADKKTKADSDDGLSLFFAMVTLSSPNSSEYRDNIDKQMHGCAELCASGNPTDFVHQTRQILQEAVRLSLPIKWHVGKRIINHLSVRNQLFSRDLGPLANGCSEPEDAAQYIDNLLTQIEDINIRIKEVNGDSWWVHNSRANEANSNWKPANDWKPTPESEQICRFGFNCNKDSCTRKHVENPKGKGGKGTRGKGKNGKDRNENKSTDKVWGGKGNTKSNALCDRKGCANDSSQYGALCKSCFDTAKTEGTYLNTGGKRIPVKAKGGNKDAKKARTADANFARSVDEEVTKRMASNAEAVHEGLTLNDSAPTPASEKVYITASEYQRFQDLQNANNQVQTPETDRSDKRSVIGKAIDMTVRGPTSHKDKIKLKYMNEETLNESLPIILDKIKSDYGNE